MNYDFWVEAIEERVPGLMIRSEIEFLMQCVELSPIKCQCIDLGTYLGKSAAALCTACRGTLREVITIDNFKYVGRLGPSTPGMVRANLAHLGLSVNILTADSRRVPGIIKGIGFLFIDTDHNAEQLGRELDAWLPYIVDRGIVALHDYYKESYPGYVVAIDTRFEDWEWLGTQHTTIGFRKS